MPRGRFLSKSISLDEKVNALSDDTARLLFTWLISHLDCEGRLHGDPTTVKSIVFPRRKISVRRIDKYLEEIANLGLILRYSVNGNVYLLAPQFEKHQTGLQKSKEAQSQIPPFTPELLQSKSKVSPPQVKGEVEDKVEVKDIYIIPEWIDQEVWDGFLEVRKRKKAASTQYALSLIIKDLEKFKAAGEDPNEILKRSITNSWKGVFPLKGGQHGTHQQNPRQLRPRDGYSRPED